MKAELKVGLIISGGIAAIAIVGNLTDPPRPPDSHEEAIVSLALNGAARLKLSMREPDSFTLISAEVINDTNVACYKYRGRNGFGGVDTGGKP